MVKRLFLLPVLLALALALSGCKDPYGASEKAAADIGTAISAGMKTVDGLRVSGLISAQEETNVLGYLKFINDANGAFGSCAQIAHSSGSKAGAYTTCAQVFALALNNPKELALIHVGNTNAENEITTIVNGITAGVTAISTALGGK